MGVENLKPYCRLVTVTTWRFAAAEALQGVWPIVAASEPSRMTMTIANHATSRPIQASTRAGLARWAGRVDRKIAPKKTRPATTRTM